MIYTGVQGPYHWLEDGALTINDLLELCPPFVTEKYLAVTSFEGGPLRLTRREFETGWMQQGRIAINPRLKTPFDIPYGSYDEWFVFTRTPLLEDFKIFVNTPDFSLRHPSELAPDEPLIERSVANLNELQELFWMQLELKSVETYIARGDRFILATREQSLFEFLMDRLKLSSEDF